MSLPRACWTATSPPAEEVGVDGWNAAAGDGLYAFLYAADEEPSTAAGTGGGQQQPPQPQVQGGARGLVMVKCLVIDGSTMVVTLVNTAAGSAPVTLQLQLDRWAWALAWAWASAWAWAPAWMGGWLRVRVRTAAGSMPCTYLWLHCWPYCATRATARTGSTRACCGF